MKKRKIETKLHGHRTEKKKMQARLARNSVR